MEGTRTGGGSLRRKRKFAVFYCVDTFILFVAYFPSLSLVGTSVSLILSLLTIMTLCAVECISGSVTIFRVNGYSNKLKVHKLSSASG